MGRWGPPAARQSCEIGSGQAFRRNQVLSTVFQQISSVTRITRRRSALTKKLCGIEYASSSASINPLGNEPLVTNQALESVLLETDFADLELYASGKVRDLYRVDNERLLLVATDRISAFDYVLATGIPSKGRVLTQLSLFWFEFLKEIVPNHLITEIGRASCRERVSNCV